MVDSFVFVLSNTHFPPLVALEVLCPSSTPKSQLNSIHPASLELFRAALSFFISTAHYKEALTLANRMADIFLAFENESSMCKMFLTITLIQLTLGDAVQAQQTYLQEHLNSNTYLGELCFFVMLFYACYIINE